MLIHEYDADVQGIMLSQHKVTVIIYGNKIKKNYIVLIKIG